MAAIAALVGCTADPSIPEPELVSPAKGFFGDSHVIEITGQGMYPLVLANASGSGGQIDAGFSVSLLQNGQEVSQLRGVRFLDVNRIEAVVPEGLELGEYDLRVVDPTGHQGDLTDAFLVTSSRVQRIGLTVAGQQVDEFGASYRINQPTSFQVHLYDDRGARVSEQVPLNLSVESVSGAPLDGTLDAYLFEGLPGADGLTASGSTYTNGSGQFDLTLHQPADVVLRVSSPDSDLGLDDLAIPLSWVAGTVYDVEIALPTSNFSTPAGAGFIANLTLIDRENRVVVTDPEIAVDAVLFDACNEIGEDIQLRDLSGTTPVRLEFSGATGTADCPEQRLRVRLDGDLHESRPFSVAAGPFAGFGVRLQSSSIQAGTPHRADAIPTDAYGNAVLWEGDAGTLELFDSIGDVRTSGCLPGSNFFSCIVTPTDADERVVLTVREPVTGAQGFSERYEVTAGPVDRLIVEPVPDHMGGPIVAGRTFSVLVGLLDEFDNDVPVTVEQAQAIELTSTFEDATCVLAELGERGQAEFDCTLTAASEYVQLTAAVGGATGVSDSFAVANNELASVIITLGATSVTAGTDLEVSTAGFDAWGNPYKAQTDPTFTLVSTEQGAAAMTVGMDSQGEASTKVSLERAGVSFLIARRGVAELGMSLPITVAADSADGLVVETEALWGWSGASATLQIHAVDRFGNLADSDDEIEVSSSQGSFSTTSAELVDGVGTVRIDFDDTAVFESFSVLSDAGLLGSLTGFPVVEDCGSSNPSVSLSFSTLDDAIACHDGTDASIDASFSGSGASTGRSVAQYGLWVEDAGPTFSRASAFSSLVTETGAFSMKGLVIDSEDCAAEVERTAWVGLNDGAPVGPIDLSLSGSSLEAGVDKTTISLNGLTTCDGKVASKADVYLRTDRASLSGVTATGSGLQVTLDSAGDGTATLDAGASIAAGDGEVVAWVSSGAARGTVGFEVTGDSDRPLVLSQDPSGAAEGDFDVIELVFSEPLDDTTVTTSAFSISGPKAASIDAVHLSDDATSVEIWLDSPITAEDGRWSLVAASSLTDEEGNGLDGAWSGSRSLHRAVFGDVSGTAPTVTGCAPNARVIRPDGDAGSGAEADSSTLSAVASSTPDHWVADIFHPDGSRAAMLRAPGTSNKASLVWNGRDLSRRVVPDGTYQITVLAVNADDSVGTACTTQIAVDNERVR